MECCGWQNSYSLQIYAYKLLKVRFNQKKMHDLLAGRRRRRKDPTLFLSILSSLYMGMKKRKIMEDAGIDPATSRMLSERSTIWANPPGCHARDVTSIYCLSQQSGSYLSLTRTNRESSRLTGNCTDVTRVYLRGVKWKSSHVWVTFGIKPEIWTITRVVHSNPIWLKERETQQSRRVMHVQLCSHVIRRKVWNSLDFTKVIPRIWGYDSWQCHIRSLYFYLFVYFSWQEVVMSVSRALKMEMCFLRRADSSSPSSIPESSEIKLFWWILTFNFLPSGKITSLPLLNFALKFFTVVNSSAAQIFQLARGRKEKRRGKKLSWRISGDLLRWPLCLLKYGS